MIDLHAHVLHRFDDGPKTIEDSIALLRDCSEKGINIIAATSHYYSSRMPLDEFYSRRERRLERVNGVMADEGIDIKLVGAAEVNVSPILLNLKDISCLCYGGTKNILLEIPLGETKFDRAYELIDRIVSYYAVNPIIAHIERYKFLESNENNIIAFRELGCRIQIDADVLIAKTMFLKNRIFKYIENGLVDIVASDCHGDARVQNLAEAYDVIEKKLGAQVVERLKNNAESILQGN